MDLLVWRHKPYKRRTKTFKLLLLLLLILKHANHRNRRFAEACEKCAIVNTIIRWRYMLVVAAPKLQQHVTMWDVETHSHAKSCTLFRCNTTNVSISHLSTFIQLQRLLLILSIICGLHGHLKSTSWVSLTGATCAFLTDTMCPSHGYLMDISWASHRHLSWAHLMGISWRLVGYHGRIPPDQESTERIVKHTVS